MKVMFLSALLTLSVFPNINAIDWSKENVDKILKGACKNIIDYSMTSSTEDGSSCTCTFCEESKLSTLFNPKATSTCLDCGDTCTRVSYKTIFEFEWKKTFFEIFSSSKDKSYDPVRVILEGTSNDQAVTLYDSDNESDFGFDGRGSKYSSSINNSNLYKSYTITFVRNSASTRLYLGHYGIVQAHMKQCSSDVLSEVLLKLSNAFYNYSNVLLKLFYLLSKTSEVFCL